ncbi:hypothetical protein BG006_001311 [Podila minutissima]|uniref:Uncharacterized protein n=1 Tax=Podila minutissima TaxID=64525 RepID=A0A9P5SAE6_9FUNG|nr:hypothetical protein BG006_001311 [Podila minutissima]
MVQTSMETCQRLEALYADKIESDGILQGEPWICRGLQRVKINFVILEVVTEGQTKKNRELVSHNLRPVQLLLLTRLAELTRLEYVVFTCSLEELPQEYMLDLRYDRGLQLLGAWTRLKHFGVAVLQMMTAAEIEWMCKIGRCSRRFRATCIRTRGRTMSCTRCLPNGASSRSTLWRGSGGGVAKSTRSSIRNSDILHRPSSSYQFLFALKKN